MSRLNNFIILLVLALDKGEMEKIILLILIKHAITTLFITSDTTSI